MDFYTIKEHSTREGVIELYPDYRIGRTTDLMVRAKSFYAIWDEATQLWSTDEYEVQRLVDAHLWQRHDEVKKTTDGSVRPKLLGDFSTQSWLKFKNYVNSISDNSTQLDEKLVFSNTQTKKSDFVSRKLPYALTPGDISAWDELVGTLYEPSERAKIEWAIGAIVSGDAKNIQKFLVFYGAGGTGKSTILNIVQKLFEGYYTTFDAKALTSTSNAFSTEVFKSNPLVAIQHDGDLSKIEDNTKLNSIVSHEDMTMNEKYKPSYMARINAFLLMGTNKPVKITDAKSGIIRRLIDVQPTGNKVSPRRYQTLYSQIDFELGAIAQHCLDTYKEMGKDYYSGYRPIEMMLQTDVFFNFIEASYDIFEKQDGVSLNQAHILYKEFCDDSDLDYRMPKYRLREELKNYFEDFEERAIVDGIRVRSWFSKFNADRFKVETNREERKFELVLDSEESIFDKEYGDCPAVYASETTESPLRYWSDAPKINKRTGKEFIPKPNQVVDTILDDIDTHKLHYVKPGLHHIVIDFDLKDGDGNKSAARNLEAASKWPSTYAEFSKSGNGVHLHYIYEPDPSLLSRIYDEGIEIKVFTGDSSLRRKLSKCNNIPIATLNSGLPIQEKKMINAEAVKSERSLRDLVARNLRKEFHAGTKPSMDFIHKILNDAYDSGLPYDLTDMRPKVMAFAASSTNQSVYCLKLMSTIKFVGKETEDANVDVWKGETDAPDDLKEDRLLIYDVEVFPNLFVVCWKFQGSDTVVKMINPSPAEMAEFARYKLVGFNNRQYDNHIIYGRIMGYDNMQLYQLSKRIIANSPNAKFREAYDISYVDIYEFAATKMGLKKWQIELGIHHKELGFDWDQPVPEDRWDEVCSYCVNDVNSTEAVLDHLKQDLVARLILADLSGLPVNATTQNHTARIVFGNNREPQKDFVYTDLSEMFPGYKFEMGKSTYRGEETGEGGYVYAEPGIYENVALLDVASMHPASIDNLDAFGPYTKNYIALRNARIAIKRGEYDEAKKMFDGKLAPYLGNPDDAEALSYALKIVINIVYGMTSASYPNPFKDPRNKDNIVAKRGALFMVDLKHAVQDFVGKNGEKFIVAHIKTDSIKIPDATPEIIEFVMEFGQNYGYEFEHEATYKKFCLVNDAVYVAKVAAGRKPEHWEAVGAQFKQPYVFKKMFSHEPIEFKDLCETKTVKTALYLDFGADGRPASEDTGERHFVGKAGLFTPIKPGCGGGILTREKDGVHHAATGTKGYFWMESEMVSALGKEKDVDMDYYTKLVDKAEAQIQQFGDVEQFMS